MPSADVLALNPELANHANVPAKGPRKARAASKPRGPRNQTSPQKAAHSVGAPDPGSSYTGRLERAARRGWHALESPDALLYRWRTNGGIVGPWGTYEEATAWGAAHGPGEGT